MVRTKAAYPQSLSANWTNKPFAQGLQPYLDEVFLPRKIHYVSAIPRNEVGKLTKAEMEKILAGLI